MRLQNGLCQYYKEKLSGKSSNFIMCKSINKQLFPKNFFKWPIHLHHNHETGMTIDAAHNRCNAVLWEHRAE